MRFLFVTGTIVGGLCLFCTGHPARADWTTDYLIRWSLAIGFGQIGLVLFYAIGWFWGVAWGFLFIVASCKCSAVAYLVYNRMPALPVVECGVQFREWDGEFMHNPLNNFICVHFTLVFQ